METQSDLNYQRIAQAIDYLRTNFKTQPSLDELARRVHLSQAHFHRMFTEWVGTSPKKFLQYISVEHAKKILNTQQSSLFDATFETGLSSTSRLHDLFVKIEGMSPAEYRDGGKELQINYSFAYSPFGQLIVASTPKGVCYMAFEEEEATGLEGLKFRFPNASFRQKLDILQQNALYIFQHDWTKLNQIKLHLRGTDFQLKVWESLLKIPRGKLQTYGSIAGQIGNPNASRAVGTAIGSNPIAYLIPCHRVIQANGEFGGYRWGASRKTAIIGWEGVKTNSEI